MTRIFGFASNVALVGILAANTQLSSLLIALSIVLVVLGNVLIAIGDRE